MAQYDIILFIIFLDVDDWTKVYFYEPIDFDELVERVYLDITVALVRCRWW